MEKVGKKRKKGEEGGKEGKKKKERWTQRNYNALKPKLTG
ncbi:hypothetical protein HmCmsJML024_03160 [Escherichia coli]|nr:hypothetical protein HmCmsJML024_03160 [Escherichia coli]